MPLTVSLQFPAGRYVAASWSDKDEAEWPPHPARFCLALIDVLHKSGNAAGPRAAIEWLFHLAPPEIVIPTPDFAEARILDGIYVPQNPSQAEGVKHQRKPRSFPTVYLDPDSPAVFFHWPAAQLPEEIRGNLAALLSSLPRLGHSSSLVMATMSGDPPTGDGWRLLRPANDDDPGSPDFRLRVGWDGLLASAEEAFDAAGRATEMTQLIANAASKAKPDKTLKPTASPRGRHDPRHRWLGYFETTTDDVPETVWDRRILVLRQTGGDRLGLESVWQVTEVFHKALLDRWTRSYGEESVPPWLSGHRGGEGETATAPSVANHLAIFPLPFVGSTHADGHLMGLGLALPRLRKTDPASATFRRSWRRALSALFGDVGELELTPRDRAWTLRLAPEESADPPQALRPERWTRASTLWQSVTPIILDRHPKPHFRKDPVGWRESCAAIIQAACERIGLPKPSVEVSPYSPLPGVPPAPAFAAPSSRHGRPPRFHIHASLRFPEPVAGPVLLGAGRFRGYGLCLPVSEKTFPAAL